MSRSERWNTANEIKRRFRETTDPLNGAGPVVYVENGRKYSDDSESHIAVIGRTGKGKSQCCSLPYMREILQKGESLITIDPKGEGYRKNACYIRKNYQVFCLDFRNPRKSPTRWNLLSTPYRLFCSKDPDDNDIASSMLSEIWSGVYPCDVNADRFWPQASANYAKGLTYGLFETAEKEVVNLDSIAVMMEQSESRTGSIARPMLNVFYDHLPLDSLAKRNLATYVTAPNETRASIHSVAASGLEVFSRSKGLMEMLGDDTLNIMDIDVERPFACFIITPDETDVYDSLSGLLISQLTQHLIRVAQEKGGRLPIRVNIILEELGSVGKSIPSLPNLMVASRSRNMRLMLVLQSSAQLVDIYGKSKAETISSCVGITVGFSTNSWETLKEWSQRCGERQTEISGRIIKEPLITASQLAAMPTGTALVMVDSQYKFIAHLPFYDEMYDNSEWKPPQNSPAATGRTYRTIDFEALVKKIRNQRISSAFAALPEEQNAPEASGNRQAPDGAKTSGNRRTSDSAKTSENHRPLSKAEAEASALEEYKKMMALLDKKRAEYEAKLEERKKQEAGKKYHVVITGWKSHQGELARIIAAATGDSFEKASKRLTQRPIDISFSTKYEAEKFAKEVVSVGGEATVQTS